MKQYHDSASNDDGQTAVVSAEQYTTLAQQLSTWRSLRKRKELVAQAEELAKADVAALTGDQAALKTEAAGLPQTRLENRIPNGSTGCDRSALSKISKASSTIVWARNSNW